MAITASQVKELREMTGAGMMDCKKALTNTDGDMDAAVEWLRENGLAKAAKKSGRIAAEGMVAVDVSEDGKSASIVEVNSETDFVAKNEVFQQYVKEVAAQAKVTSAANVEAFLAEPWAAEAGQTVEEKLKAMIAKIGENMNIRRFEKVTTDGLVVSYIHAGGKIGVLVVADTDSDSDAVKECLKNVAMQIAALNPKYVSSDDVDADYKEHEKQVLLAQAKNDPKNAGKPDEIIEKMINEKFEEVNWKLFKKQENGAIVECCECTYKGVGINKDLNNGHKIVSGLDIIRTLSKMHDVYAPIFVDNAEAVNDFNYPSMETQMILLKVSDDKELRVESEE